MSDQWDTYLTQINDQPASVLVDLGIGEQAPREGFAWRIGLFVQMNQPRQDGLCEQAESEELWKLEDALVPAMTGAGAVFVGRVTTQGRRDFFFYAPIDQGFEAAAAAVLEGAGFHYEYHAQLDSTWAFYRDVLWPSEWDWNGILNRRVLASLSKNGDDLSQPRRVHHWVSFASAPQRDEYAAWAREQGYGVRGFQAENPDDPRPFRLHVHRFDALESDAIDPVTWELKTRADETGGEYEGWEAQCVQPGQDPVDDAPPEEGV